MGESLIYFLFKELVKKEESSGTFACPKSKGTLKLCYLNCDTDIGIDKEI